MRPMPPSYPGLARWLLEREAGPGEQPPGPPAAERVCAKLQEGLAKLVGPAGFDALLRRALFLAQAEHPLLEGVETVGGACFARLANHASAQDPAQVYVALASVFGHFISLLSSFIGDDLAGRQIRRIWPDAPLSEAGSAGEEAAQ